MYAYYRKVSHCVCVFQIDSISLDYYVVLLSDDDDRISTNALPLISFCFGIVYEFMSSLIFKLFELFFFKY